MANETLSDNETAKLEALRQDIDAAWKQADAGEFIDYNLNDFLGRQNACRGTGLKSYTKG